MVSETPVPYLDSRTVLGLSAVWRCVTIIADAIADLPWREWTGPEDAPVEIRPVSRLVRRPMSTMTRREWTWRVVATEALYGIAHCLKVGGRDSDGLPWSLLPIPPAAISPKGPGDSWGMLPPVEYWIGSEAVDASEVVVIRRTPFPGVPDHVNGILNLARRDFGQFLAASTAGARYWTSGGPTTAVLTTDQELTNAQADLIGQRWADRRAMGANFPAVLGKGAKAEPWGADPTAESAVEARRELNADIGRYFGVPTRLLNAPTAGDSQAYENAEHEGVDLARYTLRGYMGPLEDAVSELLPGDYILGRRMRLDAGELTAGDFESRSRAWPALVAAGIFTTDEARQRGFRVAPLDTPATPAQPVPEALPGALAEVQ